MSSLLRGGPVTRMTLVLVAAFSLLNFLAFTLGAKDRLTVNPYLTLVPGYWTYPWVFVTAGLVETNPVFLIINVTFFWFSGRYLENLYGSRQLAIFILLVNSLAFFLTFCVYICIYAFTADAKYIYETQANGLCAVTSAFLVAFKNVVPEHRLSFFQDLASIRVKYIPSVIVLIFLILEIGSVVHSQFYEVLFGATVAWVYIRFYKRQDGIRGDRSETFSFVSFFPEAMHAVVAPLSNTVFSILLGLGVCSATPAQTAPLDENELPRRRAPPGSEEADTERRRLVALKALESRLQAQQVPQQQPQSATGETVIKIDTPS